MNGKVVLAVFAIVAVLSSAFIPVGFAIPWYQLFNIALNHHNPLRSPASDAIPIDAVPALQPHFFMGGGGRAFTK